MDSKSFLLPNTEIFDEATSIDCIRQTLITLTNCKVEDSIIKSYIPKLLANINENTSDMVLEEVLLVLRQCFERKDKEIQDMVKSFFEKVNSSRPNFMAAIVCLNSAMNADKKMVIDDEIIKSIEKISEELAPQFHAFKLHKNYNYKEFKLSQKDALAVMLSIIKNFEIKSESVLETALFLWHLDTKLPTEIDFSAIISNTNEKLFQNLFVTLPRERFLFLCSDPKVPSIICPLIAEKLNDFSDVQFFLRVLSTPQSHIPIEKINDEIKSLTDCRILTARLRNPLLKNVDIWNHIIEILEEKYINDVAQCFLVNITDVSETLSELLLNVKKITPLLCQFYQKILSSSTEIKTQFSKSQLLSYIISNMTELPPFEFYNLINSLDIFKCINIFEDGNPIALIILVYHLILSNDISITKNLKEIKLPDLNESTQNLFINFVKSLDGNKETFFSNIPNDNTLILLIAYSLISIILYKPDDKNIPIKNLNQDNVIPFLILQIIGYETFYGDEEISDFVGFNKYDLIQSKIKSIKENICEFDIFTICKLINLIINSDSNLSVLILLFMTSDIWDTKIYNLSTEINENLLKSICSLNEYLQKSTYESRLTVQIKSFISKISNDILPFLLKNYESIKNNSLSASCFFKSKEEEICSQFLNQNCNIDCIKFFTSCFYIPPKCKIISPSQIKALYSNAVSNEKWEDASAIAALLSSCDKLSIIDPSINETIQFLLNINIDFNKRVPQFILNLIKYQLKDENTQLNAIITFFKGIQSFPIVDLNEVLMNFSKHFESQPEILAKGLSTLLCQNVDEDVPIILRPEPLPVDDSPKNVYDFVELMIDALLEHQSQKLFILLRSIAMSYSFLFAKISQDKRKALFSSIFKILDNYESNISDSIQAALLLLGALITIPSYADDFFMWSTSSINEFSTSQIYFCLKIYCMFFSLSNLASSIVFSYFDKNNTFENLAKRISLLYSSESKLYQTIILTYNNLIQAIIKFTGKANDLDVIDIEECIGSDKPFSDFISPGFLRSKIDISSDFCIMESSEVYDNMCDTFLSPSSTDFVKDISIREFLMNLYVNSKPIDVTDKLPEDIPKDKFKALKPYSQSLLLRERIRIPRITYNMMRVLLRKPFWIRIYMLQNIPCLLLPEHYIMLSQVISEMNNVKDDSDLMKSRKNFIHDAYCQDEFVKTIISILDKNTLPKAIVSRCIDTLSSMLSFKPAMTKCINYVLSLLMNSTPDNLYFIYLTLMVLVKTEAHSQQLTKILNGDFFASFLQPNWRNNEQNMELLVNLINALPVKPDEFHPRIIQLVSFLYMHNMFNSANSISFYLTDEQKQFLKPIVKKVYEYLKNLNSNEHQVDLINLCRAYPYLNYDPKKLLNKLDILLENYIPYNLEIISAIFQNLMPPEKLQFNENHENIDLETPIPMPVSIYSNFPEFWNLMAKHRSTLTEMAKNLRFSAFISSPLNIIYKFPLIDDTQLKINYFNYLQKKKLENNNKEQKLEVSNENVVETSLNEMLVKKSPEDWANDVTITLLNSEYDWYTLISKQLFDPNNGLFKLTPNLRCLDINPERNSEKDLQLYKFAGFFLALALKQNKKVDVHLAPSLFKNLLKASTMNLHDLEIVDPIVARSYKQILNGPVENLGLFFTIGVEKDGKAAEIDLIQNGFKTPVTDDNKEEYIKEMLQYHFKNYAPQQIKAFCEGFYSLLKVEEIAMFTVDEFEILLCGIPKFDIEDFKKNCIISYPYHIDHPVIKRFFYMLKNWDQIKLGKLLWFITGSSYLPIGGFATLKKNSQAIQIERGNNVKNTPISHTCYSILDLPEYPSLDYMEKMFSIALDNTL